MSSVSNCQQTPIYKPFTQCKHPSDCPPHPAPHSATEEELHFVKTCLRRWRTEVEHDINGTPETQNVDKEIVFKFLYQRESFVNLVPVVALCCFCVPELKNSIDKLTQTLEGMYSDNSLCQVTLLLTSFSACKKTPH